MKTFLTSSLFTASLIALSLTTPVSSVSAAKYYACQPGFTFSTKGGAARCVKPSKYSYKPLLKCPNKMVPIINKMIGTTYRKDYNGKNGNTDQCVGKLPPGAPGGDIVLNINCPSGYQKQIIPQKDKCRKFKAAITTFPNRAVSK